MVIQYNYFIAQTNICRLPFAALLDSLPLIDQVANKMLQKKDCQQIPPNNTYPQQITKKRMLLFWFWYLSFEYVCFVFPLVKQLCPWNSHLTALAKVLLLLWHPLSAAHIYFGAVSCSSDLCFSLLLLSKFPPSCKQSTLLSLTISQAPSPILSLQAVYAALFSCDQRAQLNSLAALESPCAQSRLLLLPVCSPNWSTSAQENDQPRHQDCYRC